MKLITGFAMKICKNYSLKLFLKNSRNRKLQNSKVVLKSILLKADENNNNNHKLPIDFDKLNNQIIYKSYQFADNIFGIKHSRNKLNLYFVDIWKKIPMLKWRASSITINLCNIVKFDMNIQHCHSILKCNQITLTISSKTWIKIS